MEHAKKVRLVDDNFASGGLVDLKNIKKHYSELDSAISQVLVRDEVDDRAKARQYQQALNKFLINRDAYQRDLEKPVTVDIAKAKEPTAEESYLSQLETAADREKAVEVLTDLKTYTPYRFNDKGQLLVNDRVVEGSDLKQLIEHELKPKKAKRVNQQPPGWKEFSAFHTSKAGIPPAPPLPPLPRWQAYVQPSTPAGTPHTKRPTRRRKQKQRYQ
jgi:hypothetical protein